MKGRIDLRRVLIVEDDPTIRTVLCEGLGARGLRVSGAAGPREAIRLLRTRRFDVVVTDVQMPGNGKALLEHVIEHHPATRVIVMTGNPESRDASWTREPGVFAYLVKPVMLDQLHATLRRALRPRRPARPSVEPDPG